MADLTIQWPDAGVDRVREATARLESARMALLARPHDEVVDFVGRVLARFANPSADQGEKLARALSHAGAFSRETIDRGLRLALHDWDGDAVRALVDLELAPSLLAGRRLRPFERISVVLGGAIPMPNLLACLTPLLVQSPALIKTASRDRVTAHLLADCLAEEDPELAACVAVLDFDGDDDATLRAFVDSPCVVASGSDETLAEIATKLSQGQRLIGYGHRFSVALVDANSTDDLESAAIDLALDTALWDQSGCLSPAFAHVVADDPATARGFARMLADELDVLSRTLPRAASETSVAARIRSERDEAAMRAAAGQGVEIFSSKDTAWTVLFEDQPDLRPAPLHRFIRIHAAGSLDAWSACMAPHRRHLSSVGFAGSDTAAREATARFIAAGASRVCALGRMQAPPIDWPHDGRPVLEPLASWAGIEGRR